MTERRRTALAQAILKTCGYDPMTGQALYEPVTAPEEIAIETAIRAARIERAPNWKIHLCVLDKHVEKWMDMYVTDRTAQNVY